MRIKRVPLPSVYVAMFGVWLLAATFQSHARSDFLTAWGAIYPNSIAGERGCQLCHQLSTGGDGWNGYGFDVRTEYVQSGRLNINAAIRNQDDADSDTDTESYTNLQEITFGLDPGWVAGEDNFIFFKDGAIIRVAPPFDDVDARGAVTETPNPNLPPSDNSQLCVPLVSKHGGVSLICL